jgi:holliday junction DNA helicase RuvA
VNAVIEFIRGVVDHISIDSIVIDRNGIGFQIFTPNPFSYQKHIKKEVTVYTYQYVREDLLALYGFSSREEKTLFSKLLNVTGIGPKGALAILAYGDAKQVVEAIENEDEAFLVKFPGVGKKTARQIILDLKGKLVEFVSEPSSNMLANQVQTNQKHSNHSLMEAIDALKVLGYSEKEIAKIKPSLEGESLSTDQYVKKALKLLLK